MADQAGDWYVRSRGRVLGPFSRAQLESLRDRGQLARFDEVSQDRRSWTGAAGLPQLFDNPATAADAHGSPRAATASADSMTYSFSGDSGQQPVANAVQDSPEWFFARGGAHQGPIAFHDIQRMVTAGEIESSGLVWKRGMAAWVPAHQVPELRFPGRTNVPSPTEADKTVQPNLAAPTSFEPPRTSGLAIASLVLGLLWLCGLGSLLAVIFASVALSQIARSRGRVEGKGLAIAGLILGILGLSILALPFVTTFFAGMLNRIRRE
jgi:GYF domain 2/Domain of unknown function (DUF4190)